MNDNERTLITGLFDRLAPMEIQPRDAEADALIRSKVAAQPNAPYLLAQSTLVLQQAVSGAQSRIADLEKQLAAAQAVQKPAPSFLSEVSSFLGGTPTPSAARPTPPPIPAPAAAPVSQPASGSGFLGTALSTAAGVAGGALLFQGIESLFNHNSGGFGGMGGMNGMGGFGGGFGAQPEVVNNYFEQVPTVPDQDASTSSDADLNDLLDDSSVNGPNADFADFDDNSSFDLNGDDSSFV